MCIPFITYWLLLIDNRWLMMTKVLFLSLSCPFDWVYFLCLSCSLSLSWSLPLSWSLSLSLFLLCLSSDSLSLSLTYRYVSLIFTFQCQCRQQTWGWYPRYITYLGYIYTVLNTPCSVQYNNCIAIQLSVNLNPAWHFLTTIH